MWIYNGLATAAFTTNSYFWLSFNDSKLEQKELLLLVYTNTQEKDELN